ncbi:MAG: SGNH/GDSL hydrolase family protein [Desulfovibrionaceae bacterium]|nr:SGNH/GDSL hydrolase family protein [Desulfovibrionaceae bacterium]
MSAASQIYVQVSACVLTLGLVFVGLNLLAWLAVSLFPAMVIPESRRRKRDVGNRKRLYLKDDRFKYLGLPDAQAFERYWSELVLQGIDIDYDPFCEFRHREMKGEFWNVSAHGFRLVANQGPWPLDPECFNIFVFGGSTTYHIGPDWTSVASRMQEFLDGKTERPARVYNFGRCSFYSAQEKILFQRLLSEGHVPDLVLFFDGLNDSVCVGGQTATAELYTELLRERSSQQREFSEYATRARTRWIRLKLFVLSLPLMTVLERLLEVFSGSKLDDDPPVFPGYRKPSDQDVRRVVGRFTANHRQIELLSRQYGVKSVVVLQPVPSFNYDLGCHRMLTSHGLGNNENARDVYPCLIQELKHNDLYAGRVVFLEDIQAGRPENLYVDEVHYCAGFAAEIAERTCLALAELKALPGLAAGAERKGQWPANGLGAQPGAGLGDRVPGR